MFLQTIPYRLCYAPIDLKLADIYIRDGFGNGTNTPITPSIEPISETQIALSGMNMAVPNPATTTGVTVKFGTDSKEYTVTARTLGTGTNEVQTIEIDDDISGGTFTLTFQGQTTGALAYNVSAAVMEAQLEALSTIGLDGISVTGAFPKWTVTFTGPQGAKSQPAITGNGTSLTGGILTDVNVSETTPGVDGVNEVQTLTMTGSPTGGTFKLGFGGATTESIVYNATAAQVELALEALDPIPQGTATVAGGPFPGTAMTVTFSGALGNQNVAMITLAENLLTGGTSPTIDIVETTQGVTPVVEVQTVNINNTITGGTFTLTYGGNTTVPILYNATAATVQSALNAAPVSANVTVTGGPGPVTDWVVTFNVVGVKTAITGTGTNLTGGSTTTVSVVEITSGVTSNETTQITITPGLLVATTAGGSVTFGGRKLEIKIGEGNLTYTENTPREYLKDRGKLDTVRNAPEEPMDVSFEFVWEFISAVTGSAIPTIEEVLKKSGEAVDWISTSSDLCEPYCVDVEVWYDPGCGGANKEFIRLEEFRYETLEHNLTDAQISCTGKCNKTTATVVRGT